MATKKPVKVTPIWRTEDQGVICADVPQDVVRLAGQRFTISGSGRIRMA